MDLQMLELSGQEFLSELREFDPGLARRAIVITGESPSEVAGRFPELPLIVPKPFEFAKPKLVRLIEAVADQCG